MNEHKDQHHDREPERFDPEQHRREIHEPEYRAPEQSERPRRRRAGREHKVHQEIVARRTQGGAPPTPDAYAEALKQWQQLPGAVVRPPSDLGAEKETPDVGKTNPAPPDQNIESDNKERS